MAKGYLTSAAVNKDEAILAWSLIKTPLPLSDPRSALYLRIALIDPRGRAPPSDSRQRCAPSAADLVCEIEIAACAREGRHAVVS